ncbi:hypothetical protein NP493_466g03025 [Ridgeia piscesae]|uniref:Uncharacterized protein n=1 Tax=Ridgeia piscesae TaxID=27915 RepID=A0AAD9KYV9_RIDPI|nr:hypothetical protein NP493_466g03025 [Ridgeia piscesae]
MEDEYTEYNIMSCVKEFLIHGSHRRGISRRLRDAVGKATRDQKYEMDVVDIPRYTEEEVDAYQEVLVQQIRMVHEKNAEALVKGVPVGIMGQAQASGYRNYVEERLKSLFNIVPV